MHFGYERMWTFAFVQLGFVVTMLGGLAFTGAFVVGARRGGRAALKYTRGCSLAFAVALGACVAYGVATGEWGAFTDAYGAGPLLEMGVLGFMWVVAMWIMATSYSVGRARGDEIAADGRAQGDEGKAGGSDA